jgi:hypothetical protein
MGHIRFLIHMIHMIYMIGIIGMISGDYRNHINNTKFSCNVEWTLQLKSY